MYCIALYHCISCQTYKEYGKTVVQGPASKVGSTLTHQHKQQHILVWAVPCPLNIGCYFPIWRETETDRETQRNIPSEHTGIFHSHIVTYTYNGHLTHTMNVRGEGERENASKYRGHYSIHGQFIHKQKCGHFTHTHSWSVYTHTRTQSVYTHKDKQE